MVLVVVSVLVRTQPLFFAHVNGFSVNGAELAPPVTRAHCLAAAEHWVPAICGAAHVAYLVGEYVNGPRLAALPVDYTPPESVVCSSRKRREVLLALGHAFVWCTFDALAGTAVSGAAARSLISIESFIKPVELLADYPSTSLLEATSFRYGAKPLASVIRRPDLDSEHGPPAWNALASSLIGDNLLRDRLRSLDSDPLLDGWLERILPPPVHEIPPSLLDNLPDFNDKRLESMPYVPIAVPARTAYLPLPPRQSPAPVGMPSCVRSPLDMLYPEPRQRVQAWLRHSSRDLMSIRACAASGETCERDRPPVQVFGVEDQYEWSRDRVWDCREQCCVVLDFHALPESGLNLTYIARRLRHYPDQYLVANLVDGVRLDADVELQSVLVPHLASLPLGYNSVAKELARLHGLGWYDYTPEFPFWPVYLNGQGATARKLEPDRFRRTTERGGPRKLTFDSSGL